MEKTNTASKKGSSKEYKVKFYSTVFRTRYVPLLKCLGDGMFPTQAAAKLGWSKQHVNYYIQRLKRAGLVFREKDSSIVIWALTEKGKGFLREGESRLTSSFTFRLHNCSYMYNIVQEGYYGSAGFKKVEMQNWTALLGLELGVSVRKTSKNWIVHLDVVRGENPDVLLLRAKELADKVAVSLMRKYRVVLGEGVPCKNYEYACDDPVASVLSKFVNLKVGGRCIDDSEDIGVGELDHIGRDAAVAYMQMPERVRDIDERSDHTVRQLKFLEGQLGELQSKFDKLVEVLASFVGDCGSVGVSNKGGDYVT